MASELVHAFTKHVQPLLPDYRVVRKSESRLMRFLDKILFFTPNFLTRYSTTIGQTIYATDSLLNNEDVSALSTLAHEARHMYDEKRMSGPVYKTVYLSPQIFALGSLLSVLAIWFSSHWLWALCSLLFLLPIPSIGRMLIERQGYLMSLCVTWWTLGEETARDQIAGKLKQFTGPAYYFMWPFRRHLRRWFERELPEKAIHPSRYNATFVLVFDFICSNKRPGGTIK